MNRCPLCDHEVGWDAVIIKPATNDLAPAIALLHGNHVEHRHAQVDLGDIEMVVRSLASVPREREDFVGRARLTKATRIADRWCLIYPAELDPRDASIAIVAQMLTTEGLITNRPLSTKTCDAVRAIVRLRAALLD